MTVLFIILFYFIIGSLVGSLFVLFTKIPEGTACVYLMATLFLWPIVLIGGIYKFIKIKL